MSILIVTDFSISDLNISKIKFIFNRFGLDYRGESLKFSDDYANGII